ncbi:MAG TPA: succinate dehydrogenase, cytochrome b556 subunit [Woeseiaceae bacterium]|nr:succinate dehydrogenase, cytochrome b556 subunit [Woeseiaceae bacterium]
MNNSQRPMSPHLFIYRWPMTMTVSILHRVTGIMLSLGLVVLVAWLAAAAGGAQSYAHFDGIMGSLAGRIFLVLWSAALFFHLANGIRHLFWDVGLGFEIPQANTTGWIVIASTVVLTLAYWLAI